MKDICGWIRKERTAPLSSTNLFWTKSLVLWSGKMKMERRMTALNRVLSRRRRLRSTVHMGRPARGRFLIEAVGVR